ncbi:CLUMA_CG007153, isoform A [Clunio marinus]|uniref:CLUMA_CG007153, isoform A n=1 Tax=Clunio marinus TaxID=568069 RepID=A0A1J1HZT6_9DIPT|nr:CLUMA_CG007153, isoform A [Clunio marinus]
MAFERQLSFNLMCFHEDLETYCGKISLPSPINRWLKTDAKGNFLPKVLGVSDFMISLVTKVFKSEFEIFKIDKIWAELRSFCLQISPVFKSRKSFLCLEFGDD